MKTAIHRRSRRINIRIFSLSLVSVAAVLLAVSQAPRLSGMIEDGRDRVSGMMRLEHVVWEEVGSTNLSDRVTQELLWGVSGLSIRQEMLRIDLNELEKRLLAVPWLESLQLQKKLPSTLSVRYTVHHARAIGLRKNRLWLVSNSGQWIAPTDSRLDLPVITSDAGVDVELQWLAALEKELSPELLQVHELNFAVDRAKLTALLELQYQSQMLKISLTATGKPNPELLNRLKRVVQYLIKNNILVSGVDLRAGKKVVVNVGKRP